MLQAMYNGVSAITATQEQMNVIGNNIANIDTTAYKTQSVTFADQLSQTIQGASADTGSVGGINAIQLGTGVKVASVSTLESQGGLLSTSSPTNLAIQGNGYFMVSDPSYGMTYTRDGNFSLDNSGNLVNSTTGNYVLGWQANTSGTIDQSQTVGPSSTINFGIGSATAVQPTANITYTGNLSADAAAGTTYQRSIKIYDSLGEAHSIMLTFTRQAQSGSSAAGNTWTWTASGDPGLTTPSGAVNQGTVTFDANGNMSAQTGTLSMKNTDGSATPQTMNVSFAATTQVSGQSTLGPQSQDGYPPGSLESFTIDNQGVISGTFSNGLTRSLGQVALASFANPQGLSSTGNNTLIPTANSGQALVGQADTLGLGSIATGYLEQSNVDLGTEFTNMIVAQKSYEANTKIVTTVSSMLDTLIQMDSGT